MIERADTIGIAVHCSATKRSQDTYVDEHYIRKLHTQKGWEHAGYNIVIPYTGQIQIARPLDYQGAHVLGYNDKYVGVCLTGGLDESGKAERNFTDAQYEALVLCIQFLKRVYPTIRDIRGHRDFSPDLNNDGQVTKAEWLKECPCFDVREWLVDVGIVV
jgi:N-acetylmuramoyl-L-alanine amidase